MKTCARIHPSILAVLAALALVSPVHAGSVSSNPTAPAVGADDIANYGEVTGTDKWWTGTDSASSAKGQSFTTGGAAVRLKSISYQVDATQKATPTKTYVIRVGKLANTAFTLVHSETATQSFTWNGGEFMTWTFASPVILDPYTTYGIDVGMLTSTSGWQTGIPYLYVTADEYPGGTRYSSGTSGTGTDTVSYAIGSDRIFHLDIERPLGPVFQLVAKSPADNATDALATREMVLTFSQNVTPGSGNITFRDLTDPLNPVDTLVAANDPRLTYDQNVVRIEPAGLLGWSKNHAIRLDAGVFLGDGGAPIAAITDDTSWNFSTVAGDPFLDAIAALKSHVTGALTLTGPQIAAHKSTIDAAKSRFDESSATISAVFDLVKTYDSAKGPLFVSGSTVTGFSRSNTTPTSTTSISPENIHWAIYTVMQSIMDEIYQAETLADPVKRALIANYNNPGGFKFGSHTDFPGPCSPPSDPSNSHTVAINGSFPKTFGRDTQMWATPARKPTGTYLAPGTIATVTVPPALVNEGYKVRVGAHSWDLSGRTPVERLERATRLYPLDATTIEVASPYGGGIYIEVPIGANAGIVNVTVTGAVRSPYFSAKSFHQTTVSQWGTEKTYPAPWADFQSDKFMTQVPRKWIYNMTGTQATQLMVDWDKAMDAINDLMGFPRDRGKETMYCQTDVILRSSVHAPGYPAVNVSSNVNSEVSPAGYANNYLVRGPGASPTTANIEFHEQGHAYFFPKFGGETESNVNLLQPAMLHRKFGYSFDDAHRGSVGSGNPYQTIDNTAVAWMCCFSFSPNEIPMAQLEKQYQLKGHAKFMDIARLFGWEGMDNYWRSFMEDDAASISYANTDDEKLLRLSRHVGKDIRPLFHFWGVHPQNPSALAASIAAENIPASPEIRDLLLRYKTLVPTDNPLLPAGDPRRTANGAYQTFMFNWWGKKPSVAGYWEETDHAMQWDETLDADGTNNPNVRPNGSIYVEASATEIRARVQELVDLYFPLETTPPTLASSAIADDKNGGPITVNTLVTYTVTFSEDMDATTVSAADFGNAGDTSVTIGTVTETLPGVFTVQATPTSAGTLRLQVSAGAVLQDVAGNALVTTSAIPDDTTLTVDDTPPTLADSAIVDDKGGSPVTVNTLVTYTVTFSEDMDASTVSAADFGNAGDATVTIGTVTETTPGVFTVPVTPTSAGTLRLQVNQNAELKDVAGNALATTSATPDDTTVTVIADYAAWAGGAAFDADSNHDGVANGMAWLLGAADPSANASALLPKATDEAGKLVLTFRCLKTAMRGAAVLKVQYSNDLGQADPWTSHEAAVPDADGTVGSVVFDTTPDLDPAFINVRAEIPADAASPAGQLFGRLYSTEN